MITNNSPHHPITNRILRKIPLIGLALGILLLRGCSGGGSLDSSSTSGEVFSSPFYYGWD